MAASTCDVCGLLDLYDGAGDGIGSCDCPRCEECGEAAGSAWCRGCQRDDYEPDGDDYTLWLGDEARRHARVIPQSGSHLGSAGRPARH